MGANLLSKPDPFRWVVGIKTSFKSPNCVGGGVRNFSFILTLKAFQILYLLFLSYHQKVLLGLAILVIKIIYISVINVNYVPKH